MNNVQMIKFTWCNAVLDATSILQYQYWENIDGKTRCHFDFFLKYWPLDTEESVLFC